MSLICLVHHSGCRFETLPDGLSVLLCDRAVFFPLLVEFLKGGKCSYHILALGQSFSVFAEQLLGFQVLAEIKVAQVVVDLHHIVEFLDEELVSVVGIPEIACRHRTDFPPAGLKFPEGRESGLDVIEVLYKVLELGYHFPLLHKVFGTLGVLGLVVLGLFLAVIRIYGLEFLLLGREFGRSIFARFLSLSFQLAEKSVKRRFDCVNVLSTLHSVLRCAYLAKRDDELFQSLILKFNH